MFLGGVLVFWPAIRVNSSTPPLVINNECSLKSEYLWGETLQVTRLRVIAKKIGKKSQKLIYSMQTNYSLLQCIRTKCLVNILKSIQGLANKTYETCVESRGLKLSTVRDNMTWKMTQIIQDISCSFGSSTALQRNTLLLVKGKMGGPVGVHKIRKKK